MIVAFADLAYLGENDSLILFGDEKGNLIPITKKPALHVPKQAVIKDKFTLPIPDMPIFEYLTDQMIVEKRKTEKEVITIQTIRDDAGNPVCRAGYSKLKRMWVVVDP